jgi:peptide deformylase
MAKRNGETTGENTVGLSAVRCFGDPTLRQVCREVTVFDKRLEQLSQLMFEVMDQQAGVGLAAPQVGTVSRILVWMNPEEDQKRYAYVNPQIVACSEETTTEDEGCLSLPGVTMEVTRPNEVTVRWQDLSGMPSEVHLAGYPARIVQHEIDHLDGCLIIDRTSKRERLRALKELREKSLETGS